MIDLFKENCSKVINKQLTYVIGVSGGVDSMTLLHLIKKEGINVIAAHVDYQLRDSSLQDQKLVQTYCLENEIPFKVLTIDTKKYCEEKGLPIQEAARNIRYDFFNETCKSENAIGVITAHHKDDNIETFFLQLERGAGLGGLKSIPLKNRNRIRPFFNISKETIISFAIENKIPFNNDESNLKNDYRRNLYRNQILPELAKLAPNLSHAIFDSILKLQEEQHYLKTQLDEKLSNQISKKEDFEVLKNFKTLKIIELRHLLSPYGVNAAQVADIYNTNRTGANFSSKTHFIEVRQSDLFIYSIEEDKDQGRLKIEKTGSYQFGNTKINVRLSEDKNYESGKIYLSKKLTQMPIYLRKWKQGDKLNPFGMKGYKLVSDIFNELNYSQRQKNEAIIVVDGSGELLGVVGYRGSNKNKILKDEKKFIIVETF